MLKFSANLNFMFVQEASSIVDRISLAAAAGFKAIEIPDPYEVAESAIASAKDSSGVEVVLMNSWPGDFAGGEYGIAIFPDRCKEFRETLERSITYLKVLLLLCQFVLIRFLVLILLPLCLLYYAKYNISQLNVETFYLDYFTGLISELFMLLYLTINVHFMVNLCKTIFRMCLCSRGVVVPECAGVPFRQIFWSR